ncbi:MAG: DnaJ domain-containing protein [Deltaproteobacteria bacterium]
MLSAEISREDLFNACESLFGTDIDVSIDFLRYLKPAGVKAAFRKKALETHPDRAVMLAGEADSLERKFKEINLAYQLLKGFIDSPWKYHLGSDGSLYRRRNWPARPVQTATYDVSQETKYLGRIPQRKLLMGQFLYYSGHISLATLIKAIAWQRMQRPSVGSLAVRWDLINAEDVMDVIQQRRKGEKFGECALRRGHISKYKLILLLDRQRMLQPQLGNYFIENKIIPSYKIAKFVDDLKAHNKKFWSY